MIRLRRLKRLRRIADTLIDPSSSIPLLHAAIIEYKEILEGLTGWKSAPHADISTGETRTENGLALSPKMAAMCLDDILRTSLFIRGTHAAIVDKLLQIPHRPLRVLYAGCGPFATLSVPLMTVFPSDEVTFTLLDIHTESIESAKTIVEQLGLESSVDQYEVIDATLYHPIPDHLPDLILVEILQSCLEKEPQVAVTRHLLSLAPNAHLIPEEITVSLNLINVAEEFDMNPKNVNSPISRRDRIPLGPVFVLNQANSESLSEHRGRQIPATGIQIPEFDEDRYQAMLCTHIRVYGPHVLEDYDSGISHPRIVSTGDPVKPGEKMKFCYRIDGNPHLVAQSA